MKIGKKGIVLLLVIGVLFFSLWIHSNREISQKRKKENKEDNPSEAYRPTSPIIENLYAMLVSWDNYFYIHDEVAVSTLEAEKKISLASSVLLDEEIQFHPEDGTFQIEKEKLRDACQQVLGEDCQLDEKKVYSSFYFGTSEQISGIVDQFFYDEDSKQYQGVFQKEESVLPSLQESYAKIVEVTAKNDQLILVEKVIFTDVFERLAENIDVERDTFSYAIYADYHHTVLLDEIADANADNHYQDISIDSYLDRASTVTYIFQKNENGSYRFVSSSIS